MKSWVAPRVEDKENAAKTWKRTFGFHPLLAFLDRPEVSGGEALAGLLRPGKGEARLTLLPNGQEVAAGIDGEFVG